MRIFGPKVSTLIVLAVVGCSVAGCGAATTVPTEIPIPASVTVGWSDSAAGELVANMYADALRTTGVRANVSKSLGSRDAAITALDAGSVMLLPEYTDALLRYFNPGASAEDVYTELNKSLPEGLSVSDYAVAEVPGMGYVVPLFRKGAISDAGIKSLDVVAGELTTADLADLISQVDGGKKSSDVAADWSSSHGV